MIRSFFLLRLASRGVAFRLLPFLLAALGIAAGPALVAPGVFGSLAAASPAEVRQARELYRQALEQDDVRALSTLARARSLNERDADVHYRIAYIYHKMNRLPEARESYEATLRLERCYARALNNLGNIHKKQGEPEEARRLYKRAIECDATFHLPHYNLGNMYRSERRIDSAVRHYEAALDIEPNHYRTRHNLGLIFLNRAARLERDDPRFAENYARAERELSRAIELAPKDSRNRYTRGRLYEAGGEFAKARADYQEALRWLRLQGGFKNEIRDRLRGVNRKLREQA